MPKWSLNGKTSNTSTKKPIGTLRRGQLVQRFSPGSIVEMPSHTVLISSADGWFSGMKSSEISACTLHDRNLEKMLGVQGFREPPVHEDVFAGSVHYDVEALLFPYRYYCPKCGRLAYHWEFDNGKCRCSAREQHTVVPSRFVIICANGHIDDFPYWWWVHQNSSVSGSTCRGHLYIDMTPETDGLSGISIRCSGCGARRTMEGALGQRALEGYKCHGKTPWISASANTPNEVSDLPCTERVTGTLRNASNVHFPVTVNALTIPPWSTSIQQTIAKYWDGYLNVLEAMRDAAPEGIETADAAMKWLHKKCLQDGAAASLSEMDVRQAVHIRQHSEATDSYTNTQLRYDEYRVLTAGSYQSKNDFQFRTERTQVAPRLAPYIVDAVLVTRLREVMALRGFRRVSPNGRMMPPSSEAQQWLPAMEMLGEGIFLRLNEERLVQWENEAQGKYSAMKKRYEQLRTPSTVPEEFTSRFVLLHTLAHLLIRQLSAESGYAAASLKERIYSSTDSTHSMAGILIYTSSTDADGSLGGLVRQGKPDALEQTVLALLEDACWCSSDPVCSESKSQGYMELNYAACHACTLLPETSCEAQNCLLDRAAVVGIEGKREMGFFGTLVAEILGEFDLVQRQTE